MMSEEWKNRSPHLSITRHFIIYFLVCAKLDTILPVISVPVKLRRTTFHSTLLAMVSDNALRPEGVLASLSCPRTTGACGDRAGDHGTPASEHILSDLAA